MNNYDRMKHAIETFDIGLHFDSLSFNPRNVELYAIPEHGAYQYAAHLVLQMSARFAQRTISDVTKERSPVRVKKREQREPWGWRDRVALRLAAWVAKADTARRTRSQAWPWPGPGWDRPTLFAYIDRLTPRYRVTRWEEHVAKVTERHMTIHVCPHLDAPHNQSHVQFLVTGEYPAKVGFMDLDYDDLFGPNRPRKS